MGGNRSPREVSKATAHLYIANPFGGLSRGFFSTHPSTEERVRRLRSMM